MPDITAYKVVYGDGKEDLEHNVNILIKQGWQPFSGLTLKAFTNNPSDFYQTMVKYGPSKTNSI